MKHYPNFLAFLAIAALVSVANAAGSQAAGRDTTAAGFSQSNPFAEASKLLYQAPPFDKIHDSDYKPAMEEGMRVQLAEINNIASDTAAPTFENTIIAMERSGELLIRSANVFFAMTSANTNDELQSVMSEEAPKLAAHGDAIYLNEKLFNRVKAIYDNRSSMGLDPSQVYLVELYYRDFVRSGALLSEPDKERLRALNQKLAQLETDFQIRLLAATKAAGLVVDDKSKLKGMSEAEIAAAELAAKDRGIEGKWVLPLQNTTQQPAQASLEDRAVREELFKNSTLRTERGDSNDTRGVISKLTELRAEKAKLLGYPNYADYILENRMAKTPAAAIKLLVDVAPAAVAKAQKEADKMQALIDEEKGGFKLQPWDWQYYAEKVRKADYDLDESQLKPYFELSCVLEDGLFYAANKLYGITFKERKDIPVYHPDVRVFEVYDTNGESMALWYCDYFKRDNKQGGAWSGSFVDAAGLLHTNPVVYNVCNFTKPAPGQPALLTYDDVTTMFHEFGHALHSLFVRAEYPRLGANVPRDFVEVPSQFNEHWALYPEVLAHYAKHYKTGEAMPQALVEKIRRTKTFNQGFETLEYVEASLLDLAWHTVPMGMSVTNVDSFETAALQHYNVYMDVVPPRYRSTYFAHIWSSGYSAAYYSYMWSEVIEDDAFEWFTENGGLTRANGQRFRDMILSRAGSEDSGDLYRAFRGHDPDVKALLENRGLIEN